MDKILQTICKCIDSSKESIYENIYKVKLRIYKKSKKTNQSFENQISFISSDMQITGLLDLIIFAHLYNIEFLFMLEYNYLNNLFPFNENCNTRICIQFTNGVFVVENSIDEPIFVNITNITIKTIAKRVSNNLKNYSLFNLTENAKNLNNVIFNHEKIRRSNENDKVVKHLENEDFVEIDIETLNSESIIQWDIDGISGCFKTNEFDLCLKKNINVCIDKESKFKIISKSKYFLFNSKVFNLQECQCTKIGYVESLFGVLNLFVVLGKKLENFDFVSIFYDNFKNAILNLQNCKKGYLTHDLNSFLIHGTLHENKIEFYSKPEFITDVFSDEKFKKFCLKYKVFFYIEKFGLKKQSYSNSLMKLHELLCTDFNLSNFKNLVVDVAKSFIWRDNTNCKSVTITEKSLSNIGKKTFSVLQNTNFGSLNESHALHKNGKLIFRRNGFFKTNIYNSFVKNVFPTKILKTSNCFTLRAIKEDFFGFSSNKRAGRSTISEVQALVKEVEEARQYSSPLRFEVSCNAVTLLDASCLFDKFARDCKFKIVATQTLIDKTKSLLLGFLEVIKENELNINFYFSMLFAETSFVEFFLKGGKNVRYITPNYSKCLKEINYEKISKFANEVKKTVDNEIETNMKILSFEKFINESYKFNQNEKSSFLKILNVCCSSEDDSINALYNEFLMETQMVFKSFKRKIEAQTNVEIMDVRTFIIETFISDESFFRKTVFFAMVKCGMAEKRFNVDSFIEKVNKKIRTLSCKNLINPKFYPNQEACNIIVLIDDSKFKELHTDNFINNFIVEYGNARVIKWEEDERIRMLFGMRIFKHLKYKTVIFEACHKEFLLGFWCTRSLQQITDLYATICKNKSELLRLDSLARVYNIQNFTFENYLNNLQRINKNFSDEQKKELETIYYFELNNWRDNKNLKEQFFEFKNFIAKNPSKNMLANFSTATKYEVNFDEKRAPETVRMKRIGFNSTESYESCSSNNAQDYGICGNEEVNQITTNFQNEERNDDEQSIEICCINSSLNCLDNEISNVNMCSEEAVSEQASLKVVKFSDVKCEKVDANVVFGKILTTNFQNNDFRRIFKNISEKNSMDKQIKNEEVEKSEFNIKSRVLNIKKVGASSKKVKASDIFERQQEEQCFSSPKINNVASCTEKVKNVVVKRNDLVFDKEKSFSKYFELKNEIKFKNQKIEEEEKIRRSNEHENTSIYKCSIIPENSEKGSVDEEMQAKAFTCNVYEGNEESIQNVSNIEIMSEFTIREVGFIKGMKRKFNNEEFDFLRCRKNMTAKGRPNVENWNNFLERLVGKNILKKTNENMVSFN